MFSISVYREELPQSFCWEKKTNTELLVFYINMNRSVTTKPFYFEKHREFYEELSVFRRLAFASRHRRFIAGIAIVRHFKTCSAGPVTTMQSYVMDA